jgi:carbon storage regulator CsrA
MLVISRKKAQKIIVADDIEITVLEVGRNRVRFGIKAPKHVTIHTHIKETPAAGPAIEGIEPLVESAEVELPVVAGMFKQR